MAGPLNGKTGEVLRWVVGLVVTALVAYFTAQAKTGERLAVVETRWEEMQRRMNAIENGQAGMIQSQARIEELFRSVVKEWSTGVDRRTGEPLPLQRAIESGR